MLRRGKGKVKVKVRVREEGRRLDCGSVREEVLIDPVSLWEKLK